MRLLCSLALSQAFRLISAYMHSQTIAQFFSVCLFFFCFGFWLLWLPPIFCIPWLYTYNIYFSHLYYKCIWFGDIELHFMCTLNDSIWHGHHNEWVDIFLRSKPRARFRENPTFVCIQRLRRWQYLLWVLYRMYNLFIFRFFLLFCMSLLLGHFVDPFFCWLRV